MYQNDTGSQVRAVLNNYFHVLKFNLLAVTLLIFRSISVLVETLSLRFLCLQLFLIYHNKILTIKGYKRITKGRKLN